MDSIAMKMVERRHASTPIIFSPVSLILKKKKKRPCHFYPPFKSIGFLEEFLFACYRVLEIESILNIAHLAVFILINDTPAVTGVKSGGFMSRPLYK